MSEESAIDAILYIWYIIDREKKQGDVEND